MAHLGIFLNPEDLRLEPFEAGAPPFVHKPVEVSCRRIIQRDAALRVEHLTEERQIRPILMLMRRHQNQFLPSPLQRHSDHLYRLLARVQRLVLVDDIILGHTRLKHPRQHLLKGIATIIIVGDVPAEHDLRRLALLIQAHGLAEPVEAVTFQQDDGVRHRQTVVIDNRQNLLSICNHFFTFLLFHLLKVLPEYRIAGGNVLIDSLADDGILELRGNA